MKNKPPIPKCSLIQEKHSGFLVLELEVKRNKADLGKSHKKRYKIENKEICSFHAFLQMKETAGRVRLRLENSICDSLSIKVSLCLLCLEKRQNPSHIFKPRKDIQKNIFHI